MKFASSKTCCYAVLAICISLIASSVLHGMNADARSLENLRPARPVIPDRTFLLTDFGAVGDGKTINTEAFRKAIAAVDVAGGGKLVVPKGVFRTLTVTLCSNLNLHLEEGAMIQSPASFSDFGVPDPAIASAAEVKAKYQPPASLITGKKLHDVAITGLGTIDGNGPLWWAWSERAARNLKATEPNRIVLRRVHMVVITGCERLLVSDVTLQNSSMFHLVPKMITDLTIERVKVRAPHDAPNTDAIDPGSSTNVWIHHCDIDTGDDDIVMKSGGSNILIEDCIIKHGHGLSIGSETSGGIRNMLVRRCTMDGTDNGIRIKSMRGIGGPVDGVRYSDIKMKNVANVLVLDLAYVDNNKPDFKGDPSLVPSIKNIIIENVEALNSKNAGKIVGLPDSKITGITLRKVTVTAEKDLVIKDAEKPVLDQTSIEIKPGIYTPPEPEVAE